MRKKLAKLNGKRIKVYADVGNFGKKNGFRGRSIETVCLVELTDENGNNLCDHLWFTVGKQMESLKLEVGDRVSFEARVAKYEKGYKGFREDVYKSIETDYKLSHPTKFIKLFQITIQNSCASDLGMVLFGGENLTVTP